MDKLDDSTLQVSKVNDTAASVAYFEQKLIQIQKRGVQCYYEQWPYVYRNKNVVLDSGSAGLFPSD